jgi:hypothetical protein
MNLDLDLDLKRAQIEGEMRFGEHVSTFCGVLFQQTKSKTSPPIFCSIFRVLDVKTLKIGIGGTRKKKGGSSAAAFIAA